MARHVAAEQRGSRRKCSASTILAGALTPDWGPLDSKLTDGSYRPIADTHLQLACVGFGAIAADRGKPLELPAIPETCASKPIVRATRCEVCINPRRHIRHRNAVDLVEGTTLVPRHASALGKGSTVLAHHVLWIARQLIQ